LQRRPHRYQRSSSCRLDITSPMMLDSPKLLLVRRNQMSPKLGGDGPDNAEAGIDAFDHPAGAREDGLADAVVDPVLL